MSSITLSILVGALASIASIPRVDAHGSVRGIVAGGQWYEGYDPTVFPYLTPPPTVISWSYDALDQGFVNVTKYSDPDIICHHSATPGGIHAEVAAGSTVELQWSEWPIAHHGPVLDYLANCNGDCEKVDKTALEFFKIHEGGLIDGSFIPGNWASDQLIANNNSWVVTIPSSIAPGNYILRHEIIALHQADLVDGAQSYPQCLNLKITGSGTASPPGIPATKFYTASDPGILFSIWLPMTDGYEIPGPPVFDDSSSSGSGSGSSNISSVGESSTSMSFTSSSPASSATSYDSSSASDYPSSDPTTTAISSSNSASLSYAMSEVTSAVAFASSTTFSSSPSSSSIPESMSTLSYSGTGAGAFYPLSTESSSAIISASSTLIQFAANPTSTDDGYAANPTTIESPTSEASSATPTTTSPPALDSVIASMTTALPTAVLTSAAPTVTATYGDGSKTFSTDGMSVADLFSLLQKVSSALREALGGSGHWMADDKAGVRRHPRDLVV